jgi:hypothetical protein
MKERRSVSSNVVQPKAPSVAVLDRSLNVVITGVTENTNDAVWRETITRALNHAAGCQIEINDAFRLGRFIAGKTRPVLVKLGSAWNRRLVIAGARKLHNIDDMRKVYISADEPLETRRQNTLDRLKLRAKREKKQTSISNEGVLSIDGIETFCINRGFIKPTSHSQASGSTNVTS